MGTVHTELLTLRASLVPPVKSQVNTELGYNYASEIDWYVRVAPALQRMGMTIRFSVDKVEDMGLTPKGTQRIVRVYVTATLRHVQSDTEICIQSVGEGADPADKAIYKAITGAKKYAYALLFALPTTDDPERSDEPEEIPAPKASSSPNVDAAIAYIHARSTPEELLRAWNRALQVFGTHDIAKIRRACEVRLGEWLQDRAREDPSGIPALVDSLARYPFVTPEFAGQITESLRALAK